MEKFAVKSNSFALYEAFKKDVEKIGWRYNEKFTPFGDREDCDCLFFADNWDHKGTDMLFSFSQHSGDYKEFYLETQYGETLAFAKQVWDKENKIKFGISGICNLSSNNTLDVSAMRIPSTYCPFANDLSGITFIHSPKDKEDRLFAELKKEVDEAFNASVAVCSALRKIYDVLDKNKLN